MDIEKRNRLVEKLAKQPEPQLILVKEFFDGNDDLGSIGCNLDEHPGIDSFRVTFEKLAERSDVEAVYAQVAELEPGEDSWPFCDIIIVIGSISSEDLQSELIGLQPDEVGTSSDFIGPETLAGRNPRDLPVLVAWWD